MTPLVPNLSSLAFNVTRGKDQVKFDDAQFVNMVLSRWTPEAAYSTQVGIACLKTVKLHFGGMEVDREAYESLTVLEDAGLELRLTSDWPASTSRFSSFWED